MTNEDLEGVVNGTDKFIPDDLKLNMLSQDPDSKQHDNIKDAESDEDEDEGLPIDRGWAWMVCLAVHVNVFMLIGYSRASGLLFVEFLSEFGASVAETTLINGVMAGIFGVSVFVSMQVLVGRFEIRNLVILGGLISSLGIILSFFATNIVELILTQGLFLGVGNSLTHGPALVLLSKYFKKKRALANAIANSGISSGAVIFPPLTKYLLDVYGLRGTLLILGGVNLNTITCGLLLRPLATFRRKKRALNEVTIELLPKSTDTTLDSLSDEAEDKQSCQIIKTENGTSLDSNLLTHRVNGRQRLDSTSSRKTEFQSQSDIFSYVAEQNTTEKDSIDSSEKELGIGQKLRKFLGSLGFYLWKDPSFICLILITGFAIFLVVFLNYIPAYVGEKGTSGQDAAIFISIAGGLDFFARLAVGVIADRGYIRRTYICAIGLTISGINCHMFRFYNTYELQLAGIIIYGVFGGIYNSFIPVLLGDILGVEHLAKSLGFTFIAHGIVISCYHPLVGSLKDITGTYDASYNAIGVSVMLAAILLIAEPLFRRCKDRMVNKSKTEENEVKVPLT